MANMTFGVNLIPHNNTPTGSNTYSLGNSNYKWKLYADELNGEPLADMKNLYYVEGPSTDTTSGTWTGTITGLSAYYDGLTVLYIPAIAGSDSGTTLNINSLGAITCYNSSSSSLDSQYTAGMPILLVYNNSKWLQCNVGGGSSSGSGDIGDTIIIKFTFVSNSVGWTCDHTFAEVYKAAYTDKVPIIAVTVQDTLGASNAAVLRPVSANSSAIIFRGLYYYASGSNSYVYNSTLTYNSTGTINVTTTNTTPTKITTTSQLTNDGSPSSNWWDSYVLTHQVLTDLKNPLLVWDADSGNYYPFVEIMEESTNEWKMYWLGAWSDGSSYDTTTIATLSDLYWFFISSSFGGNSGQALGNVPRLRSFPAMIYGYGDERAVKADYPNTTGNTFQDVNGDGGRVCWITLDSVKGNMYEDENYNSIYTYSFIFTSRDVRDEDNALVLRTFILRGDGTEDVVAGVPIQIREAVLPTVLSPTYYTPTETYFWDDSDTSLLSVSGSNAYYNDISWSGNLLPRENYTSTTVTNYSFANVESSGYMYLNCGDGESSSGTLYYNSHVCTTNTITIPAGATKLYVKIARSPVAAQLRIGLIDSNASTAFDYTTGDGVQGIFDPTAGTGIYSIDVGERAGATNYRIVISIRAQRQTVYASFNILSVWFE